MVRLAFHPHATLRLQRFARQNSLLTSTTVSHGFIMEWHSSPPFGSHDPCNHSKPRPLDTRTGCSMQPWLVILTYRLTNETQASGERVAEYYALLSPCLEGFFHSHCNITTSQHARSIDSLVRVTRRAMDGCVVHKPSHKLPC